MTNWVCKDFYFFEIFGGKTERQSDLPSQSLQTAKINSSCGKICAIVLFQSYQKRIKPVQGWSWQGTLQIQHWIYFKNQMIKLGNLNLSYLLNI